MRDQPLIKTTRVRIPTVLMDEWTERAVCFGKTATVEMCQHCTVMEACGLLYEELVEKLEDPETLTGVWGGKDRGREKEEKFNPYAPPEMVGGCKIEGCPYSSRNLRKGLCNTHYRKRNEN